MAIVTLAAEEVGDIITNNMEIDGSLLSILFQTDSVTRDHKIMLFTTAIPVINEDTCKDYFDKLQLSDLKRIFEKGGGRRNYEKSKEIDTILNALKRHGWIYDYYEDERNSDRFVIIKNKPYEARAQSS